MNFIEKKKMWRKVFSVFYGNKEMKIKIRRVLGFESCEGKWAEGDYGVVYTSFMLNVNNLRMVGFNLYGC